MQEEKQSVLNQNTFSWLWRFTRGKRGTYLCSIILAMLGAVQARPSGEYKNIICERVDQIEVTLAHVTPEFTANLIGAVAMFVFMMNIDWRVGLWQLICIPAGFIPVKKL